MFGFLCQSDNSFTDHLKLSTFVMLWANNAYAIPLIAKYLKFMEVGYVMGILPLNSSYGEIAARI